MFKEGDQVVVEVVDRHWGNYSSRMVEPGTKLIVQDRMVSASYGDQCRLSDGMWYNTDWLKPVVSDAEEYTGGSVSYYTVHIAKPTTEGVDPYDAECNDIIEALEMNYAEGNAFKAIWRRCAARKGKAKRGYTDGRYDAEKVVFFGQRMVAQED